MTLPVLPGWNTFDTGMSLVAARLCGAAGLNPGYCASARMRPVLGCITTMVQFLALVALTWAAQACSAYHWMSDCRVSLRLPAGTCGLILVSVSGIGWPVVVCSTSSLPSRPASSELYCHSRPASPCRSPAASVSVKPSTLAPSSPFG